MLVGRDSLEDAPILSEIAVAGTSLFELGG
jgi:hypothetical protein